MPAISPRTAPAEMTLRSAAVADVVTSTVASVIAKPRFRIIVVASDRSSAPEGIISELDDVRERACRVGKARNESAFTPVFAGLRASCPRERDAAPGTRGQ